MSGTTPTTSPVARLREVGRLVTARELADVTGLPLSRIYFLERAGELPSIRLGRARRFDPAIVADWLAGGGTADRANGSGSPTD